MPGRAGRMAAGMIVVAMLASCAGHPERDPLEVVKDGLFYDGLAAYHEGYYREAAIRWERAAEFGDADAARNLGHLYRQGLGVEEDASIAASWYLVAAEDGHVGAQYNLGMLYLKGGIHLEVDRAKGLQWLEKAAAGGLMPARAELERQKKPAASETPPAPPPPSPPPPPEEAKVRVQVGSYRSRAEAEADWKRLRRPGLDAEYRDGRTEDGRRWVRLMAVGEVDAVEAYCRDAALHRVGCWPGRRK